MVTPYERTLQQDKEEIGSRISTVGYRGGSEGTDMLRLAYHTLDAIGSLNESVGNLNNSVKDLNGSTTRLNYVLIFFAAVQVLLSAAVFVHH